MSESVNELLLNMQKALDEIRSLFILANQEKLKEEKKDLLPENSIKRKIYNLCDGARDTSEIAKGIGKSTNYVNSYLSILRRDGLIRSIEKDGKLFHEQIF